MQELFQRDVSKKALNAEINECKETKLTETFSNGQARCLLNRIQHKSRFVGDHNFTFLVAESQA